MGNGNVHLLLSEVQLQTPTVFFAESSNNFFYHRQGLLHWQFHSFPTTFLLNTNFKTYDWFSYDIYFEEKIFTNYFEI
jgi:hypothetical protein